MEGQAVKRVEDAWPRQRFFLVCTKGRPHWWDRWLQPGFTHCYLLIWDEVVWLLADPTLSHLRVAILDQYEPEDPASWLVDPDATIIEARPEVVDTYRARSPWVAGPLTCVETCKAVLGIRDFWILTPWQLYRRVRRTAWDS
jgi:hypothetical protein